MLDTPVDTAVDTATLRTTATKAHSGDTTAQEQVLAAVPALLAEVESLRTVLALQLGCVPMVEETVTEWGVQWGPTLKQVRYNPSCGGSREPVPYTEGEALSDSHRNGNLPVVSREVTTFHEHATDWKYRDA